MILWNTRSPAVGNFDCQPISGFMSYLLLLHIFLYLSLDQPREHPHRAGENDPRLRPPAALHRHNPVLTLTISPPR